MRPRIPFHISWLLWVALLFFPYSEAKHLFVDQLKKPLQCASGTSSCTQTASAALPTSSRTFATLSSQTVEGLAAIRALFPLQQTVAQPSPLVIPVPSFANPQPRAPPEIQI